MHPVATKSLGSVAGAAALALASCSGVVQQADVPFALASLDASAPTTGWPDATCSKFGACWPEAGSRATPDGDPTDGPPEATPAPTVPVPIPIPTPAPTTPAPAPTPTPTSTTPAPAPTPAPTSTTPAPAPTPAPTSTTPTPAPTPAPTAYPPPAASCVDNPGTGYNCGDVHVIANGDPNTVYYCEGSGPAKAVNACGSSGCRHNQVGTADQCNSAPSAACGAGDKAGEDNGWCGADGNVWYCYATEWYVKADCGGRGCKVRSGAADECN